MSYTLKGKLIGRAPILFNRFTEKARDKMRKRKGGAKPTIEQCMEEARQKTYEDEVGLYLPAKCLKACLLQGSRMMGQKRGARALHPYLKAVVFPSPKSYFGRTEPDGLAESGSTCTGAFVKVTEPDGIDVQDGRNPNQRSVKVVIYRPYLDTGWEVPFELQVMEDAIPPEQVVEALDFAGVYCGLLDYRPEYGRFGVEWEDGDGHGSA